MKIKIKISKLAILLSTFNVSLGTIFWINISFSQSVYAQSEKLKECVQNYQRELGVSADAALNACVKSNDSTKNITLKPISQAGNWWVYEKPDDISDSQMNAAGAKFYASHVACSLHHSLCTNLSGTWLSENDELSVTREN